MGGDPSQFVSYGKSASPTKRVFCSYTAAMSAGYPTCYDFDSVNTYQNVTSSSITLSTAADSRRLVVEKPSVYNNLHFAGVLADNYTANTGGQWVQIYPPGSICNIKLAASVADVHPEVSASGLNSGQILTFGVGKWYFKKAGLPGTGSATVLQNMSAANLCMAELQTGPQSGGYQEYTCYTGVVNATLAQSARALTRGGVTEVVSVIDGTNISAQSISANHYSLSAGDYVGQQKLIKMTTSACFSEGYLVVSIALATQVTATCIVVASAIGATITARAVTATFSANSANSYLYTKWNGLAWEIQGTGAVIAS